MRYFGNKMSSLQQEHNNLLPLQPVSTSVTIAVLHSNVELDKKSCLCSVQAEQPYVLVIHVNY